MDDHVAVGEVQDDDVVGAGVDALDAFVADLERAHLGLEVIGRDLRRGDEHAVLTGVLFLDAAVEEERDMRVLLRLGDAQLRHAELAQILAEPILHGDARPRDGHVRHGCVILRAADVGSRKELALEAVEIGVDDGAGNLAGTVGTEVEADDAVIVGNRALAVADDGLDELIRDARVIGA